MDTTNTRTGFIHPVCRTCVFMTNGCNNFIIGLNSKECGASILPQGFHNALHIPVLSLGLLVTYTQRHNNILFPITSIRGQVHFLDGNYHAPSCRAPSLISENASLTPHLEYVHMYIALKSWSTSVSRDLQGL